MGNTNLSDQLNDLGTALTNLVQTPTSAVYQSQAAAAITSIVSQVSDDPFLAQFASSLTAASTAIATATTASGVDSAVVNLGTALSSFGNAVSDEALYGFTLTLAPNSAIALPNTSSDFEVLLQNNGSQAATYDLGVTGLPSNVTAVFTQNGNPVTSVTLQPGQQLGGTGGIILALSETGGSLFPAGFSVTATAEAAQEITSSVAGTLTVRPDFVAVSEVDASPPFTEPGSPVDVTAKVLNAVNQQQQAQASYTVTGPTGSVVFTSTPVPLTLTVQTSLATVDLGSFSTTGLTDGSYAINVTVTDASGKPIPGGTGQGSVLVGTPLTPALSVSPTTLPAGTGTVTNTLSVEGQSSTTGSLALEGQVQTTPTGYSVALYQDATHDLAYVAGSNGIDIVDVSNPADPIDLGSFGDDLIVQGGNTIIREETIGGASYLIVGSTVTVNGDQFTLLDYSLANPLAPTLVNGPSGTPIDYAYAYDMLVEGNTVVVPTAGFNGYTVNSEFGTAVAIDISNPAAPVVDGVLYNDQGPPNGGDTPQFGGAIVNNQYVYLASTNSGTSIDTATGRVLIVNYSNPNNLILDGTLSIPGTVDLFGITIQGNRAQSWAAPAESTLKPGTLWGTSPSRCWISPIPPVRSCSAPRWSPRDLNRHKGAQRSSPSRSATTCSPSISRWSTAIRSCWSSTSPIPATSR